MKKLLGILICMLVITTVAPSVISEKNTMTNATIPNTQQTNIDGTWTELQKLLANDGAAGDLFGCSVSLDGDTALIGVVRDDDNGDDSGSAYVFTRTGSTWSLQAKLLASDGAAYDYFGQSVALDGDTALIGARLDDDNGHDSGSAYVFTRTGSIWTQQAKIKPSDGTADDYFGQSVALDGDTALIGAAYDDVYGVDSGSAYVFTGAGSIWTQQAKIKPSDGAASDYFGESVALDGDTALVGAAYDDDNGDDSGSVYVCIRTGITWSLQAKLLASDGALDDRFGQSVALDGDTALIGAYWDDDNGDDSGSAYVFTRTGSTWSLQVKLLASDGAASDYFGRSISLDGDTALIGAYWDDDNGFNSGSAYVFTRTGSTWSLQAKLHASDGAADDRFGWSVALDGDTALIGANWDDDNGDDSGSVYVFQSSNHPPNLPTIDGPINGKINTPYQWNFTTIDPDDDDVFYQINWGDGTITDWLGAYPSGETTQESHVYTAKGTYTIKCKAKDIYGNESDWGTLPVTIPYSHSIPFIQLCERLLERFTHALPLLRHIMGY